VKDEQQRPGGVLRRPGLMVDPGTFYGLKPSLSMFHLFTLPIAPIIF
jgi:hypothetical protein